MSRSDPRRAQEAVDHACEIAIDATGLRVAVVKILRRHVPFDCHVWVLTDPETGVGAAPYADIPELSALPTVVLARYLTPELRWTTATHVTRLSELRADQASLWRTVLAPYSVTDVVSVVHGDRYGTWAFLDLWRRGGTFTDTETALLATTRGALTAAIRRLQASSLALPPTVEQEAGGPGVLLVGEDLRPIGDTATARAWLARLLPPSAEDPAVPAVALNVAAQLLAREAGVDDQPARARVHLGGGRWITARADRWQAAQGPPLIAVSLEETAPRDRLEVYTRAHGLTERETEVVGLLALGLDTHAVADRLGLSPHTVQDHLKSVFDRTGIRSRAVLLSRALGVPDPAGSGISRGGP